VANLSLSTETPTCNLRAGIAATALRSAAARDLAHSASPALARAEDYCDYCDSQVAVIAEFSARPANRAQRGPAPYTVRALIPLPR